MADIFHFIYGIILPIDFHICSRWLKPPSRIVLVLVLACLAIIPLSKTLLKKNMYERLDGIPKIRQVIGFHFGSLRNFGRKKLTPHIPV